MSIVTHFFGISNKIASILLCVMLSIIYVASLHVWKSVNDRDHPSTIKKRCISVLVVTLISPLVFYIGIEENVLQQVPFLHLLGIRIVGIGSAVVLPLCLTVILFLGPITMKLDSIYTSWSTKRSSPTSNEEHFLIYVRNYIIAPFSEEFTFRSCMLPLLLQCFNPVTAVIVCPLFFGIPHFHHMHDRIKFKKEDFSTALHIACFQFSYTTIFGMYSAYILLRTNHLVSAFIVHCFCNIMGFPDILTLINYESSKKAIISVIYVIGFVMWCFLLNPLTKPHFFQNNPWYQLVI